MHTPQLYSSPIPLLQHALVIAIVMALHLAVLTTWLMQPSRAAITLHEMELSFAVTEQIEALPQKPIPAQPMSVEQPVPKDEPEAVSEASPAVAAVLPSLPDNSAASDIEPDYKASYLNNRLSYPLAARRAGIQGRVLLNVEVLADGMSGQLQVHQSSGYTVLDRAALNSVKTWRFVPARRAGRTVSEWFKIPIQFSLKDNEA